MNRLDKELVARSMVNSRSQAENYIKLGVVTINGRTVKKSGFIVAEEDVIKLASEQYVSRAALKLESIADKFALDFRDKTVLDVGSSTGGFTDYALKNGAKKEIAVDVGTDQLHPSLQGNKRIELYEKTDIRNVCLESRATSSEKGTVLIERPDIVVMDVSFISLTKILPHISTLVTRDSQIIAMCKPQFEAGKHQTNKGIIKNNSMRRKILQDFEYWLKMNKFIVLDKADSQVSGTKGNVERFYKIITTKK